MRLPVRIACAAALAGCIALTLGGCGQKGPLYLPDRDGSVVTRPAPSARPSGGSAGASQSSSQSASQSASSSQSASTSGSPAHATAERMSRELAPQGLARGSSSPFGRYAGGL
jgi:predicted small lipoprotein YifL